MFNSGLFKLVINDSSFTQKYFDPVNCVEEFFELESQNNDNKFYIGSMFDSIREIFLNIKLPKLKKGIYWKNNLSIFLIKNILIKTNYNSIELDNEYIKNLLLNDFENYSNKLLFKNLSFKEIKSISKKEYSIIIPLKIDKIFADPNEIIMVNNSISIQVNLNYDNLIEKDILKINMPIIQTNLIMLIVYYNKEIRNKICNNNIFQKQKIIINTKL